MTPICPASLRSSVRPSWRPRAWWSHRRTCEWNNLTTPNPSRVYVWYVWYVYMLPQWNHFAVLGRVFMVRHDLFWLLEWLECVCRISSCSVCCQDGQPKTFNKGGLTWCARVWGDLGWSMDLARWRHMGQLWHAVTRYSQSGFLALQRSVDNFIERISYRGQAWREIAAGWHRWHLHFGNFGLERFQKNLLFRLTEAVSGPVSSQYLGEAAGLRSLPWNLLDFYKTKCGKIHEKTKASRLQQLWFGTSNL